jgi:hypothetical protein
MKFTKIDLTGQRFGRLTVTSQSRVQGRETHWFCICDCGTQKWIRASHLKDGSTKSCHCIQRENLTGQRFGKLVVTDQSRVEIKMYKKRGIPYAHRITKRLCICDCGNHSWPETCALKSGNTKSCGCLSIEKFARRSRNRATHGASRGGKTTREYVSWAAMRDRCRNTNSPKWQNYGGRGITVCDRWKDSFQNFLYDMGPRPSRTSLDRINNDGNYEPGNCRWEAASIQRQNQRAYIKIQMTQAEKIAIASLAHAQRLSISTYLRNLALSQVTVKVTAAESAAPPPGRTFTAIGPAEGIYEP